MPIQDTETSYTLSYKVVRPLSDQPVATDWLKEDKRFQPDKLEMTLHVRVEVGTNVPIICFYEVVVSGPVVTKSGTLHATQRGTIKSDSVHSIFGSTGALPGELPESVKEQVTSVRDVASGARELLRQAVARLT